MSSLAIGDKAPDFNMPASNKEGSQNISLKSLFGQNLLLYFYPKDDTPGCTVEAKDFRDLMNDFGKANTVIIGVSKDSVKSHDKFREKYCLPFTLASDETGEVCADYDVWKEKSMYGKKYFGIERSSFLIDKNGTIRNIWRKVSVDGHARETLTAAQNLA